MDPLSIYIQQLIETSEDDFTRLENSIEVAQPLLHNNIYNNLVMNVDNVMHTSDTLLSFVEQMRQDLEQRKREYERKEREYERKERALAKANRRLELKDIFCIYRDHACVLRNTITQGVIDYLPEDLLYKFQQFNSTQDRDSRLNWVKTTIRYGTMEESFTVNQLYLDSLNYYNMDEEKLQLLQQFIKQTNKQFHCPRNFRDPSVALDYLIQEWHHWPEKIHYVRSSMKAALEVLILHPYQYPEYPLTSPSATSATSIPAEDNAPDL